MSSTEKYKCINTTSPKTKKLINLFLYIRSEKKFAFKGKKYTLMSYEYMDITLTK